MRDEQLAVIRQKCIAANPTGDDSYSLYRPIRLADVLLATPHLKPLNDRNIVRGQAESVGNAGFIEVVCRWNLRADNLDQQSDETIVFLADLLK